MMIGGLGIADYHINSLIVPKNVKWGPLGFFNIHSVEKHQKIEEGTL